MVHWRKIFRNIDSNHHANPSGPGVAEDTALAIGHYAFGLLMSLNMLIETREGFDFTAADCIGWMKDAGFAQTRLEHLVGPTR